MSGRTDLFLDAISSVFYQTSAYFSMQMASKTSNIIGNFPSSEDKLVKS